MFDELLSQMEDVLKQTKHLKGPGITSAPDYSAEAYIDPTKTYGKVASFSKSQRFKPIEKQVLKTCDIEWPKQSESVVLEARRYSFSKKERFQSERAKYVQTYINPDYNLVKKNNKNNVPIYRSPSKTLADSKVSISTVDSQTFRAPGLYNPKQEVKVKNGVFSKDNRFKQEKHKYHDTPLMINQNQTRKRPPMSSLMKPRTVKNKQLISRQQQEELRQKLKLIYWRNIPLQFDRLFKNNTGPIMRQDYFVLHKLKGTQKRSALLMMMNRLNYMRGGFEQNISSQMDAACGVVYRKSTPKPFKFSQMDPGPDYYYPADDYIKPNPVGFSFGREGVKEKPIEYDYRDYEIKEDLMKKGGNIVINPIHQQHRLTKDELASLERGPGFYDCIFKLIQKRTDIGAVAYQQITVKNARQNNCIEIKEVNDGIYFPNYQAIDPNIPAPLYKEPANVKPQHLPDKVLFPEHWLFYDGDLRKVRAEIAKNVILAKNMSFKEYKAYKEKFNRFKEYLEIQRKGPEAGQYTVKYDILDPHVPNIEFGKQEDKTLIEPITKPEGDYDGDNLILNPQQPKSHLPNINFKKMEGRPQPDIDRNGEPKQGDRLILQPKRPQKHIANVNFSKQEGRLQGPTYNQDQACPQGDVLIINPKRIQPHIPKIDFARQAERPEIRIEQDENEEVNIVNLRQEQPNAKGVPFSRLSSVRLVPLLRQKSRIGKRDKDEKEEGND